MKRYCIEVSDSYNGDWIGVDEDPKGEWVRYSDIEQRIKEFDKILGLVEAFTEKYIETTNQQ